MKKTLISRLLSLVLVLVMVCSMLPVSAFAARSCAVNLKVSSYSAPFINGSTGEHSVYTYTHYFTVSEEESGSTNPDGYARAYFEKSGDAYVMVLDITVGNYHQTVRTNAKITNKDMSNAGGDITWGNMHFTDYSTPTVSTTISITGGVALPEPDPEYTHTLNYDLKGGETATSFPTQTVTDNNETYTFTIHSGSPTKEGHTFQGWSTTDGGSVTHQPSGTISVGTSATLYAVWEEVQQPDPAPNKPANEAVRDLVDVVVYCGESDEHGSNRYDLEDNTFTVGDVAGNEADGYAVTVTIQSAPYAAKYNNHELNDTDTKTITLTWNGEAWVAGNPDYVSIKVKCISEPDPQPQPPTAPGSDDVTELLGNVTVYCGTVTTHEEKTYALEATSLTIGQVSGNAESGYTVPVTVQTAPYAAKYGDNHALDDDATKTVTLAWDAEEKVWTADAQVRIKVKCTPVEESTWTIKLRILEVSDDYNIGYSYVTGETTRTIPNNTNANQLNVTVPSFDTVAAELGYQLKENYGFTGITWDQSPSATSMINIPTTNTTSQISNVYVTSNGYTIWYVVKEAEPVDDTPEIPSDAELTELLKESIIVDCVNNEVQHADRKYGLMGTWSKQVSEDGKTITVSVATQSYCDAYNTDVAAGHTLVNAATTATLTVTWDEENEEWTATPITIQVKCETPEIAPNKPTDAEIKDLIAGVSIDCINKNKKHVDKEYGLIDGTYKIGSVKKVDDVYTSYVEIKAEEYIEEYNAYKSGHKLAPSNGDTVRIPLEYVDGGWELGFESSKAWAHFEVVCKNKPASNADLDDVPKTGDRVMETMGVCAAVLAGLAVMAVILSKKRSVR